MKKFAVPTLVVLVLALSSCSQMVSHVLKTNERGYDSMIAQMNVMVPMRDGIKLATDIYRPRKPGKYPAILCRMPYGTDLKIYKLLARMFVSQGYIFLNQDTRGTFSSEGTYFPLAAEWEDGHDTVDWVVKQPWFNGKLGAWGGSYFGYTQWEEAVDEPAINAMVPMLTTGNMRAIAFRGGAAEYASFTPWNTQMQNAWNQKHGIKQTLTVDLLSGGYFNDPIRPAKPILVREIFDDENMLSKGLEVLLHHPGDIDNLYQANFDPFYARVSAPCLLLAGWYDMFTGPQLEDFKRMRQEGKDDAKMTRIIIGPWTHGAPGIPNNPMFHQSMTSGIGITGREMMAWYDHWLKGKDNGAEKAAPMKIFVMGENQWRDENEWPLARTKWTSFYLHSSGKANSDKADGKLDMTAPAKESSDQFDYDPANPVPTMGGNFLPSPKFQAGAMDQAKIEKREDVLVYVTDPLQSPVEVTGPVKMILYARSDARDTDFTAKLVDVWPDGKVINLCDGIIRARYRSSITNPSEIVPGKIYQYEIDMWATSNLFKAGHRIGLEISSSNFPQFDRNTNCLGEGYGECHKIAHQTILHDLENQSRLVLPVIPR